MMTPERMAEIRDRLDRATAGEWRWGEAPAEGSNETKSEYLTNALSPDPDVPLFVVWCDNDTDDGFDYLVPAATGDGPTSALNAEFIANARQDVPDLLAEVDRLRAQVAAVEAVWMMWRDDEDGSMPWKFVRDMDVVFPEVANRD